MPRSQLRGFTLIELLVVIGVLTLLIALLLPALSRVRKSAIVSKMSAESARIPMAEMDANAKGPMAPSTQPGLAPPPPTPLARVSSFEADVTLTPRLSIGTAEPESIYEAKFAAKIKASAPADTKGESRLELPLPPQIISLADLAVTMDGKPVGNVMMEGDKLVWQGALKAETAIWDPAKQPVNAAEDGALLDVTYSAVGKGIYALQTPPGKVLEHFQIKLTAAGSDVRMLELSMQPTNLVRGGGQTTYTWDYRKLMFGRPIAVDVLGIAPIDRLGELSWLGPMSVVAFGLIVGMIAQAWDIQRFDRWMLLLVLGTFAGAYPLMYFAQEFISLESAVAAAAGVVLLVIGLRAITIMGWRLALLGVILPAACVMTLTLSAALRPSLQGILLTALVLALFILTMMLAPRLKGWKARPNADVMPGVTPTPAL